MDRKEYVRLWITIMLKRAISYAKRGDKYNSRIYIENLRGMLFYMKSVGDITVYTDNKIYHLTELIVRQYMLYLKQLD